MKSKSKQFSQQSLTSMRSNQNSNLSSKFQKYLNRHFQIQQQQWNCQLKFKQLLEQNKLKKIGQILKQSRGKNTPIQYEENFNFLQRWETQNKQIWQEQTIFQFPDSILGLFINIILLMSKSLLIWGLTMFRMFQMEDKNWIFALGLVLITLDLIMKSTLTFKHYFYLKNNHQAANFFSRKNIFAYAIIYFREVYCLFYYVFALSFSIFFSHSFNAFFIYDCSVIYFQYLKAEALYKKVKIFGIRSAYKNFLNLFDLMSLLLAIFHVCGVLIYGMTKLSQQNWIVKQEIQHQNWLVKYIQSWYFTCTTMLTVGYGDITPSNYIQKIIISFVQIIGVALNGYVINQVGHTLSKIRQTKQNKQKDISDTQKLAKVYRLNNELAKKMRDYIVHNTIVNQELNIQQENNLLHKLNDQLRTEINNENHLKTIKQNIFFIFYFSKKAQIQFAKRLKKILFSPNESIWQTMGKEKLYILTKGKIQLYTDKKLKDKFYCKKMVKTIQKNNKQISDNVFGYSSILYGKPTNLRGITKDFTVCYTLDKQDIHQVIQQDRNDFQYFFQLKDKILAEKYPEKWQVPSITSIRFHYQPSVYCLIKRQIKSCKQIKNQRRFYVRSARLVRTKIATEVHDDYISSDGDSQSDQNQNFLQIDESSKKNISLKQRFLKYQSISKIQNSPFSTKNIIPRSYKRKYLNKKYQEKKHAELIQSWQEKKQIQQVCFQVYKQYQFYFPKKNLGCVLQKLRNKMSIQTQLTLIDPKLKQLKTSRKKINI